MRRYKIVACIILILPAFTSVLAAPVSVQEVCEACAGSVDGGGDVKAGSVKRAGPGSQKESSPSWQSQDQGSSSAPDYATGTHPNPSSPGESKPPLLSTSGGTELSWNPEPEGEANLIQPGTSTRIRPTSPSEAESDLFPPSKKMRLSSGEVYSEMLPNPLPPPGVEGDKPIQPASSRKAKSVSWAPSKEVQLPSGEVHSEMLPPPPAEEVHPPSGEIHAETMAAQQSPSTSEYSMDDIARMLDRLKFKLYRRIPGIAGGVVTEG